MAGEGPPQSPAPDPLVGTMVSGRYRIDSLIAKGGMGRVYRGIQEPLGRSVAIKVLAPADPSKAVAEVYRKRFLREAMVTSKLTHPNTIVIHDYGPLDDDRLYIVMEYLEGRTLREVIVREGLLEAARVLHIGEQVCASLSEAHKAGIIHRDLKSLNVMLVTRGGDPDFVKILDFGLVKQVENSLDEDITGEGNFVGSPGYMAPEQILGGKADPRSDVYSVGVLLYEMLTGRTPFSRFGSASQPSAVLMAHLNTAPPPLRATNPKAAAPPLLERAIFRCLEKKPEDRFASMDELQATLKRCERELPVDDSLPTQIVPIAKVPASDPNATARELRIPGFGGDPGARALSGAQLSLSGIPSYAGSSQAHVSTAGSVSRGSTPPEGRVSRSGRVPEPPIPVRSLILLVVLGAVAILSMAAIVVVLATREEPQSAIVPPPAAPAAPLPAQPAPEVVLRIESVPPGADVLEGGRILGTTPLRLSVARSSLAGTDRKSVV